nr:PREDICTED: NIF3-like protein 1 isoform X1 [Bemisia tabaci]XP_018907517.1 PREDICTED: NIF3-like protein 1 isoform X1 [Bemisia tabaci]XP_018907518.1 PREDICTED: NIF3-like protein 1 isoform X1 [Bemisia tabaci]
MRGLLLPSRWYFGFVSSTCLIKEQVKGRVKKFTVFNKPQTFNYSSSTGIKGALSTHCDNMYRAPTLSEVVKQLEEFAPLSLAEPWDNVGLLLEPAELKPIETIFFTNDLTELVLEEAIEQSADLIISYHPPLFKALKRITQKTWKERIVSKCLKEGIAVYSPHTCWDTVYGGVNDWLLSGLPAGISTPIIPNKTHSSSDFQLQLELNTSLQDDVNYLAIKKFVTNHPGSSRLIFDAEGKLESVLISDALLERFEEETNYPSYTSSTAPKELSSDGGTGRILQLSKPITIQEIVDRVKDHCGLHEGIQVGLGVNHSLDSKVTKIAACAGSGSSVLNGIPADVYLTGEMSHHDVLEASHNNVSVILTHHSNSERGFLDIFSAKLADALHAKELHAETYVSEKDCDPLTITS